MSIDYEDAWNRARPGTAFSNGTEWECWSANWCDRCTREAPFRNGISNQGCPLILIAMSERVPAEWFEQPWSQDGHPPVNRYHCIEFRAPGNGGGEPRPKPDPPDMDGLFERPDRQTRMYVPVEAQDDARRLQTVDTIMELL